MEIKENRPSYCVFERRPIEDRDASIKAGHYITTDVDFAIITPIGSKDRIPRRVDEWFAAMEQQVREERLPRTWYDQYRQSYEAWKRGEELPLNGTPIKGWQLLSPSQQQNVISANVLTVEDLAACNEEACRRIGMGAVELRQKAQSWLKAATDKGAVASENTALRSKLATTEAELEAQREINADLRNQLALLAPNPATRAELNHPQSRVAEED